MGRQASGGRADGEPGRRKRNHASPPGTGQRRLQPPPSGLPDTNSTRRIGIRNAAASGGGHLYRFIVLRHVTSLTTPPGSVINGECSLSLRKLSRRQPVAWWETLMAEIKFSCPQCRQHISGDEQWSGRQIQCPTCATALTVPQVLLPPVAAPPVLKSPAPQPPPSHGPKLSAGVTQVPRSTAPGPIPHRQLAARPPRTENPLLKYVVYAIVLAALGGAGYMFVPSLLSKIQDSANSKPAQTAPASDRGGAGPLGEVNGAMDVSETLDGGSSSQPRPAAARHPVAAQTPATPAAGPAVRATNDTSRGRFRQPGRINPPSGGH